MSNKFKIGDFIYTANARWSNELIKCPVCHGTRWVFVKPFGSPDSDGGVVLCDYCTKYNGWSAHPGQVSDQWSYIPVVETMRIDGIIRSESSDGEKITYKCNQSECCWTSIDHDKAFADKGEAARCADNMAHELQKNRIDNKTQTASGNLKSAAWRLGYHRKAIKQLIKDFQHHAGQIRKLRKTRGNQ